MNKNAIEGVLHAYIENIKELYGVHLKKIILYGSYARGDANENSDIDIMILLDISDMDIKKYRHKLTELTFDYNIDNDMEIMPIAKNEVAYEKWLSVYPFYENINREGVVLYAV